MRLIDASAEFAAAFKPNSAFFEALGPDGMHALREVIAHVPAGIPVILDAKRGDIGDTSAAYATAAFDVYGAHAITVNPYLGGDGVAPFIARAERGAFVLCKTSNAGADEFQRGGLSERVARAAQSWNTQDNVGLVVGATDPAALARMRAVVPELWFLVPGIGAQGGDLQQALQAGLRADGLGMLINASRSIARAADPAAEARRLRDEINSARAERASGVNVAPINPLHAQLAQDLLDSGCVKFGQFTLKSGMQSPIYLDLRQLISDPSILRRCAQAYAGLMQGLTFDRVAGIPYAGLPIATAISLETGRPLIYPRKEAKAYGTKAEIEGAYKAGETALAIDDLITDGGAKFEAFEKLEAAGLQVRDLIVLIDREQGGREKLAARGYILHAVVTLRQLLELWRASGAITAERYAEVRAFLGQ